MLEKCMVKIFMACSNVSGPYGDPILETKSKIERVSLIDLMSAIGS
jgi:hypothetical protein